MIQTKINNTEYKIEVISESEIMLNSKKRELDIISISDTKKHLILNHKSYEIEHVEFDKEKKIATIKVNNNSYTIELKDKFDLLLNDLGMSNMSVKIVKEVKAPMPGLVVSIKVEKGQEVKEGEAVLILEAMKMENVIKSPVDGIIKSVKIEPTNTVEKNQILVEFE